MVIYLRKLDCKVLNNSRFISVIGIQDSYNILQMDKYILINHLKTRFFHFCWG